ncbi:hypothetical protein ACI7BZ_12735 [Xanthobacter sp. AM11]|uniref:hypothetical protein n=1 Tax=Xanthobacter sp. AM11 TaxID=3380643 RepID=UPI0039BF947A
MDGATGSVTVFAEMMLNGVANPASGLGSFAYDPARRQLFASDLHTGMIHRFAVDGGAEPGPPFDHGIQGRVAAGLAPVAFDPAGRPNIANARFKADDPKTWGFAPSARRVIALAVHDARLFYSVNNGAAAEAPQIWSVVVVSDPPDWPPGVCPPGARWGGPRCRAAAFEGTEPARAMLDHRSSVLPICAGAHREALFRGNRLKSID